MLEPKNEIVGVPSWARGLRQGWDSRILQRPANVARILRQHFFRRFFSNDSLPIPGDPETAVFRALSFCAVPTLMFAFWLLPQYPGRPAWSVEADRYFFVLFSFVMMGAVAACEWEMLFPDRADFLILLTLPLKPRELLYAKGSAILILIGLFLAAGNIFSAILFPAVSTARDSNYLHTAWAHLAAVSLAGIFGAFSLLAILGILLCLLPSAWFRAVSTVLQTLSITLLLLLFLLYPLIAGHLGTLLENRAGIAQYIPPLWFLGLYENLMQGSSAPSAAPTLAGISLYATATAIALAVLTYPPAWSRQKKRALEGASHPRVQSRGGVSILLHQTVLRSSQSRAIFHFIGQTIARSPRYRVFFALYAGAGLAMAGCTVVTLTQSSQHTLTFALSTPGLHASVPLLLFWLAAGLRASFAFPLDLQARWVFPINLRQPPQQLFPGPCAKSSRTWTLLGCGFLTVLILACLLALRWSFRDLIVQAVCAASLCFLLTDLFFLGRTQIPFTRLRMPGLALAFFLYVVFFPTVIQLTVHLEQATESRLRLLAWILLGTLTLHILFRYTDQLAQKGIIGGFPEDETDPGPQTLGLFQ